VIEESPSPAVDPELRREMGEAAVAIAEAVAYEGVGTVEFLLDEDRRFYFLEMNTRLQVEHPVTELVTGIDLVAAQLEIAAGEKIALPPRPIEPRGASLECRLYAEDPTLGFIPSPGRIEGLRFPSGPSVRLDAGVAEGSLVTPYYDPLIAKLLTWGRSRTETLARMRRALADCLVVGIQTNLPFHLFCLDDEVFCSGDYSIRFVEDRYDPSRIDRPHARLAARIAGVLQGSGRDPVDSGARRAPSGGWKLSTRPGWRWS
jgi:acetyl/propionyl-CoA carboxylase alpha subunit